MDGLSIIDPDFVELDAAHQNEALEPLLRERQLIPTLLDALDALPWNPEEETFQDLWLALASLQLFETRIDRDLFKPLVRSYLKLLVQYQLQAKPAAEEPETFQQIWGAAGLSAADADEPARSWGRIYDRIVLQAGAMDWERAAGFVQAVRRLAPLADKRVLQKLISMPLLIILGSKPNRRALDVWKDVWNRTSYEPSDLFYHDSRLRRSLLDENVDHSYYLMSVLGKSGEKPSSMISAVIRAAYDIDYKDDRRTLGLFVGASGLLEAAPLLSPEHFRLGLGKLIWDLAYEPKREHERIFYDEISLLKSREILIDFRKAMLRSDFIQAWGYAEYAFVHGFEPLDMFDELVRLSASYWHASKPLLWGWKHLAAVETLLRLLPEEHGIYVMAHTVRIMSRAPKNPDLLDPFPDEEQ